MSEFAKRLIRWQQQHGRHDLPWQSADAYRVWLSEIMLQQTQVTTVIPYYLRFVARFPDVAALAAASEDDVLAYWSGLGYYTRARNLHRAAQAIMQQHDGEFPRRFDVILALPGVGRSTAAAISVFAFHQRHAILDGNVKRVLARYFAIKGFTGEKKIEAMLWSKAESLLPVRDLAGYTQGLMDLGATVCTRSKPECEACPVYEDCAAYRKNLVAQIPAPRPCKVLPEKQATFLLLVNGGDILLEKRPGSGVWGGMWCLPQLDGLPEGNSSHIRRYGLDAAKALALSAFTHTFTHFRLHIAPLLWQVKRRPKETQTPGKVWLDREEAIHAAIPAPVRKLLRQLNEEYNDINECARVGRMQGLACQNESAKKGHRQ